MRRLLIPCLIFGTLLVKGQQFYLSDNATVYISPGANLEIGGDLENDGALLNEGVLSLYGDWRINNIFNGNLGRLQFLGGQNQTISPPELVVNSLTLNQSGEVSFTGNEFRISDDITFLNGVMRAGDDTRFILESDVRVIGGSAASYFQGRLTYQGSGIRKFPMGWNGIYGPITMLEVFGSNPEITVAYQSPNAELPTPDEELIGVSSKGIWEVQLSGGTISKTPVQIDFSQEDLENFAVTNNIRHKVNSPVIAVSDSPGGVFTSLGVSSLLDTDSATFGSLVTQTDFAPAQSQTAYFAIGLSPIIDPRGLVYIPEVFSPAATDVDNQTFKVFGERIVEENFRMEIYNRYGSLVYSTLSFSEANQIGWDGTNQNTGREEPSGLYFYQVVLTRINGEVEERSGPFYLQR